MILTYFGMMEVSESKKLRMTRKKGDGASSAKPPRHRASESGGFCTEVVEAQALRARIPFHQPNLPAEIGGSAPLGFLPIIAEFVGRPLFSNMRH